MTAGKITLLNTKPEGHLVDRTRWERLFGPLLDRFENGLYLQHFENEVFKLAPYDWDPECDCDYDKRVDAWWETHQHTTHCVDTKIRAFQKRLEKQKLSLDDKDERFRDFLTKKGIPYTGCMVACDCGVNEELNRWSAENDHAETCRLIQPNFWHKPSGYKIRIYKYAFRTSYANKDLRPLEVGRIVQECIASLGDIEIIKG